MDFNETWSKYPRSSLEFVHFMPTPLGVDPGRGHIGPGLAPYLKILLNLQITT